MRYQRQRRLPRLYSGGASGLGMSVENVAAGMAAARRIDSPEDFGASRIG